MTIFDTLTLIGGLCLFLFGMNVMGDALERRAGSSLKNLLARLTQNKVAGFLTGLGVTADHCSNIAACVIDAAENNMNVHQSVREIKVNNTFGPKYSYYTEKYKIAD